MAFALPDKFYQGQLLHLPASSPPCELCQREMWVHPWAFLDSDGRVLHCYFVHAGNNPSFHEWLDEVIEAFHAIGGTRKISQLARLSPEEYARWVSHPEEFDGREAPRG